MKKLYSVLFFIILFVMSLVIFFPYQTIISYIINKNVTNLSYSSIEGNFLHSKIIGIKINDIELGDLTVKHSPINLILLKSNFYGQILGLNILGEIDKNKLDFEITGKPESLNRFLDKGVEIKDGNIFCKGTFYIKGEKLNSDIGLSKSKISAFGQQIDINNFIINAELEKNKLNIKTVESKTKPATMLNGIIYINFKNIYASRLNLKISIKDKILNMDTKIGGTVSNPRITF